ncbi:uncharacterized protein N7487_009324 [Penicillium crustosum]|uniref:uncharacterized protein n=1 Tax=Penicillium crustosum TaxID=36656 RepID=UPI002388348A|nr:uncharacterized protein N7487_009324 [Penicillium crustosum]KAJ5395021.1 hypothetical protein N7487_009324 [Penicillium crustosum]
MHFTHLLLLTVPFAAATPDPLPEIDDLIDDITNIAESAANWGGNFATSIYNEATSLVDAVQTGDTYSSMVSNVNDIASAWETGTSESATQTAISLDSTPTHEAKTSPAEGLRAHGAAACLGYGFVAFLGVIVAL